MQKQKKIGKDEVLRKDKTTTKLTKPASATQLMEQLEDGEANQRLSEQIKHKEETLEDKLARICGC